MNISKFTKLENDFNSLVDKFDYLLSEGLEEYKKFALELFEMARFPDKKNKQISEQIFYKTLNDYSKKIEQREYYVSNAICFLHCTKMILTADFLASFKGYTPKDNKDVLIYNYYHLFQYLLYDSMILLKEYEKRIIGEDSERIKIWKNPIQINLTLYHSLKQLIFGQLSFHSNKDLEIDFSVSRIRNMIELRLRQAFGIVGAYDNTTDIFYPISMNKIFEILKEYQEEIEIDVPLHIIQRVYSWANIYVHAGFKDYSWKPIFVLEYFKILMSGKKENGKWSANNGIRISQKTFENIRKDLKESLGESRDIFSAGKPEVNLY